MNLSSVAVLWFRGRLVSERFDADRQPHRVPHLHHADPDRGDDRGDDGDPCSARNGERGAHRGSAGRSAVGQRLAAPSHARQHHGRGGVPWRHVRVPGQRAAGPARPAFTLRPGQACAIIGGTGSGKSTLLNLIPRFVDATGGRCSSTGPTCGTRNWNSCGARSGSSRSGHSCSAAPWRATCGSAGPRRPRRSCGMRSRWHRRVTSWPACRDSSMLPSTRAARTCPVGSGSGCRSPGRW